MPRKTGQSRIQYGLFATPLEDLIALNQIGDQTLTFQCGKRSQNSKFGLKLRGLFSQPVFHDIVTND